MLLDRMCRRLHLLLVADTEEPSALRLGAPHQAFAGTVAIVNNRVGRIILIVVGALALIIGLVWVGQGSNLIPGGLMAGSSMWLTIGLIVGIVGIVLLVFGIRRPRNTK